MKKHFQLISLLLCLALTPKTFAQQKPNFVFILTDDQSYGHMAHEGNKIVKTPNLDQLATEGMVFSNAHITSAICTPSRISILLSQYERKHGVNFNSGTSVSEEAWNKSYPMLMRNAGYYTGWVGKNHAPIGEGGYESGLMDKSFDYWYAGHGHLSFYPKERHKIFKGATANTQSEVIAEGVTDFLETNDRKLEGAVHFLENRAKEKPFMLSVCFNLPHGAGTSTMKLKPTDDAIYRTLYRDIEIPLSPYYVAKKDIKTPKLPADLLLAENRQEGYNYVDTPEAAKERTIREYEAMTGIDRMVGQLRLQLKAQGLDQNTVIIFTSDHGLFSGEQGLGGKALCYEKTTHVPFIVFDPRNAVSQKKTSAAQVQSIDIAPTMLAMAGIPIPESFQGKDLSGVLNGTQKEIRKYVFTENLWSTPFGNPRCEAIQTTEWKYIRYYKNDNFPANKLIETGKQLGIPQKDMLYAIHDNGVAVYRNYIESPLQGEQPVYEELYNLKKDPNELNNLIADKKNLTILTELKKAWGIEIKNARGTEAPKVLRYTNDSHKIGSY